MISLKSLLKEYIIREGGPSGLDGSMENSSLDAQVDKLLAAYEKEAKNLKKEGYDFRSLTRRILLEEDDEEEKKDDEDTDTTNSEEESDKKPAKLTGDDIDVISFAASITRLIDNYDNLLEIRDTLIRRSREFLKKNYTNDVVSNFLSVLRDQYDIEIGMSDVDKEFSIKAPDAAGAGPSPSGGG